MKNNQQIIFIKKKNTGYNSASIFKGLHPLSESLSMCEIQNTKTPQWEWVWHLHQSGDLRSNHRLVWLKRVGGRRHAGVYTKGPSTPRRRRRRPESTRPSPLQFLLVSSTSEASWVSGSKNIAVCSLFRRRLKLWTSELLSRALRSSGDPRGRSGRCCLLKSEGCFRAAATNSKSDLQRQITTEGNLSC